MEHRRCTRTNDRRPPVSRSIAVVALALALSSISGPAHAWWNCTWTSRVALDVTNSGGALTNAVVETALNATQLPGYAWTGSDADLRIVDADDLTTLAHYSEPRPGSVQRLRVWFRVPTLPSGTRRVFVYYGNSAATSASTNALFTATGVRLLTRQVAGTDPTSLATFLGTFDAASQPTGYGCTVLPNYTSRSNANVFGATTNVHYSMMFFLDVPAAQAGNWRMRLGPDYGLGGALYVQSTALQEAWNDDLWWSGSFTNTAEILQGTVNLAAGRNFVVTYGSEGCCEGASSMQLQRPGSTTWLDLNTTNFTLVAPSCPVSNVVTARVADSTSLAVRKTSATRADPFNSTTNPKAIPGARVRYTIRLTNGGSAQIVDTNSLVVIDRVPTNTSLVVADIAGPNSGPVSFIDGSPSSGITYSFSNLSSPSDDLAFSNDGGATFAYTPSPDANGVDANVTHIRVNPKGRPTCTPTNTTRSADIEFDVVVQ
jgi:uncharacterized repeat protein (TIGR01451 family)